MQVGEGSRGVGEEHQPKLRYQEVEGVFSEIVRLRVGLNQVDMEDSRRRDTLPRERQHRSRDITVDHVALFANRPRQPQQCSASAAADIED